MPDSREPAYRYRQVAEALRDRIQGGEWVPGERIPTEAALAAEFDVNRLTVRQAITQLRIIGLVDTRQGSGTYVANPVPLLEVSMASDDDVDHGSLRATAHPAVGHVHERLLSVTPDADAQAAALLSVPASRLFRIATLLESDETLYAVCDYWIDGDRFPGIADGWDDGETMGMRLQSEFDVTAYYSWRRFRADAADPAIASQLGVTVGAPLLIRDGVSHDEHGSPVSYVVRRMRGDRVAYTVNYLDRPTRDR